MEFIPSKWLTDAISENLGLKCQENDETCNEKDKEQGISRLGSTNIVENMGIMLLILSFITLIVVLVLLLKTCMYKDYRWYRRYMMLRQRFFWNVFIRYVLQSELKLLISAGSVLMLEIQSGN